MSSWLGDKRHRDWLLAALLGAESLAQLWLSHGTYSHRLFGSAFAGVICATVAFRRRYPAAAGVLAQATAAGDFMSWHNLQAGGWTIAWFCSLYALAVWASTRQFVLAAAFVVATDVLPIDRDSTTVNWSNVTPGFAAGCLAVMLLVRRIVRDRDRRASVAEREREVAAREAVVQERARIARELHDAIAHNVSMMVVQAGAERKALEASEGGPTQEVLRTIERVGRGALTEMRRLVGMLRSDTEDTLAPQPRLADISTLATQVREAGLPVEVRVEGERRELPVGIELAAYRIVQEALTNALKHAGATSATVRVAYGTDSLELEVSDTGAGPPASLPGGGHGLAGMRERAMLYGGRFDASARPEGGFSVRVLLPVT
jgi:signal transduction histidine kinase